MITGKHLGAASELRAIVWLLDQGYEVYRNVSAHGMVDVIATRGTELLRLDIKTVRSNHRHHAHSLTEAQEAAGVLALLVYEDGGFEIRDTAAWAAEKARKWAGGGEAYGPRLPLLI